MSKIRIIGFCFAGRRSRLEILIPYLKEILDKNFIERFDFWNFSWEEQDRRFVESLADLHEGFNVRNYKGIKATRGSDLAGQQILHVFSECYKDNYDFVLKVDDDVTYISIKEFEKTVMSL